MLLNYLSKSILSRLKVQLLQNFNFNSLWKVRFRANGFFLFPRYTLQTA